MYRSTETRRFPPSLPHKERASLLERNSASVISSRVPQYTGALLQIEKFSAKKMPTDLSPRSGNFFCLVVLAPVEKKKKIL